MCSPHLPTYTTGSTAAPRERATVGAMDWAAAAAATVSIASAASAASAAGAAGAGVGAGAGESGGSGESQPAAPRTRRPFQARRKGRSCDSCKVRKTKVRQLHNLWLRCVWGGVGGEYSSWGRGTPLREEGAPVRNEGRSHADEWQCDARDDSPCSACLAAKLPCVISSPDHEGRKIGPTRCVVALRSSGIDVVD